MTEMTTTHPNQSLTRTQENTIKQVLHANRHKIQTALPKHLTADRMIRVTMNALIHDANLLKCTPDSVYECVIGAATYGWEIGGPLAEAYLVAFKDNKAGVFKAVLIPGYRGLLNLARNSGEVSTILRGVVREGDAFKYSMTMEPPIMHEPETDSGRSKRPIKCIWVMAKMKDGGYQPLVMNWADIEAHRNEFSQAYRRAERSFNGKPPTKDSPWHTHPEIMGEKTVLRRFLMQGHVPMSAEMRRLVLATDPTEDSNEIEGSIVGSAMETIEHSSPAALDAPTPEADVEVDDSEGSDELPDGVVDGEWFAKMRDAVAAISTVGNCNEFLKEALNTECETDTERDSLQKLIEERKAEIKATRGTNSNRKTTTKS